MTPDSTIHPHDDLAVYAIDALEPRERAAIDVHLADCAACRAELDVHVATLGQMTVAEEPPAQVWAGISQQIAAEARPLAAPEPAPAHMAPGGLAAGGPLTTEGPQHMAPGAPGVGDEAVVPLARRRGPRRALGRGRVLAAAAAVLVVGALGAVVLSTRDSAETGPVAEQAAAAAGDDDSTVVELTSLRGEPTARVVVTGEDDFVVFDDLPALPSDQTYQLWRTDESTPVSLGVLGDGSDGAAKVSLPDSTASFAISAEPAGGSNAPTDIVAS